MTLSIITRDITDERGNLLEGAVVTVRQGHGEGGALADLFSDAAGATPLANPITVDTGTLSVYVDPGRYRLEGTSSAGSGVSLVDASVADTSSFQTPEAFGGTNAAAFTALYNSGQSIAGLKQRSVYDLGATKLTDLVYGDGAVRMAGATQVADSEGNFVGFDPAGSSIYAVPNVWSETANTITAAPGDVGKYFNVAIAPGSNIRDAEQNVWRSTIVGQAAGESIKNWERTEAIGSGAMRFAPLANRITAVGTITYQWLGAPDQQWLIDTFHDFWNGEDKPGDPGWDWSGLETRNPGIGAWLDAFDDYATARGDCSRGVAVGRDAALHAIKESDSVYVGYQAGANVFSGDRNVAVGSRALRDGIQVERSVGVGRSSGFWLQEGAENVFLGDRAGDTIIRGEQNIIIGSRAADFAGSDLDKTFVVQSGGGSTPLLVGEFEGSKLAIGLSPQAYSGGQGGALDEMDRPGLLISNEPDSDGGLMRFRLRDTTVVEGQVYGTLDWYGIDSQGVGVRGEIKGVSQGTTGAMSIVFATQPAGSPGDNPTDRFEVGHAGGVRVMPQDTAPAGNAGRMAMLESGHMVLHDGDGYNTLAVIRSGTTANRPTQNLVIGQQYFDTDLNFSVEWNGSSWTAGGSVTTSGELADFVRDNAAALIASSTILRLQSGDQIAVPCDPSNPGELRAAMEYVSLGHSVPTGARLFVEVADGLHFVTDVIEISNGSTVEVDATAAPVSLVIESIEYTDAGAGLWDARITVSGGIIPAYVATAAGAVVGVQNPVGNGTPDAVAQGLIVTTRHSDTEITCRFRPQGVLPLVDMTAPTSGVSLGITQNRLVIPRACVRADGANPDWTPGGVGNREGFINALEGSKVIWRRLGLTKSGAADGRELLFARDQGGNFAILNAVVVGDCDIVVRSAYGGDYRAESSFFGCGTTGVNVWQGIAGTCHFDAIRSMIGGGTSNIISATAASQAFFTQCVITGAAVAFRPTYWGAVIDFATCRVRHCGVVANPQQGIINFRSGNSIEFCTSPILLTGAGVEGRVHGNPTFANNTNAAPAPNVINANGAIWRNGTGRPVDPTLQSVGVFTAALDFGAIAPGASQDLTIAATGAALNDYVILTRNNSGWLDQNVIYEGFVSDADVVTVRAHNVGTILRDPTAQTIRALVLRSA